MSAYPQDAKAEALTEFAQLELPVFGRCRVERPLIRIHRFDSSPAAHSSSHRILSLQELTDGAL